MVEHTNSEAALCVPYGLLAHLGLEEHYHFYQHSAACI